MTDKPAARLPTAGLRVGVVGVTGALGEQLLDVLGERHFPVASLLPIATDNSLGAQVEIDDHSYPVVTDPPSLRGLDVLFLCVPRDEAMEWVRQALRAEVLCVDLSGAVAASPDVPLLAADLDPSREDLAQPVLATAPGPALAWALVLAPIQRSVGLGAVIGTSLQSAAGAGKGGIDSLQGEVVSLFNQSPVSEPSVFPFGVAFDCVPTGAEGTAEGAAEAAEDRLRQDLHGLIGDRGDRHGGGGDGDVVDAGGAGGFPLSVTCVRVPTFIGDGASLAVRTREPLAPGELLDLLAKAPGVEVWEEGEPGPTLRDTTGRDAVLVGRVRAAAGETGELLLWLAADSLRMAAQNAVRLVEARLQRQAERH